MNVVYKCHFIGMIEERYKTFFIRQYIWLVLRASTKIQNILDGLKDSYDSLPTHVEISKISKSVYKNLI